MKYSAPKGTSDILEPKVSAWEDTECKLKNIAERFGYEQIRTPVFENTALFARGVGDTTDIVQKEMYTFLHRGKESLTLRPEGTSPAVRSYIENGMGSSAQPVKLFYISSFFRAENPQKGRYRQFHQFGIEAIGSSEPIMDAEVISLADFAIKEFGIKNIKLNINSVGCPECRKDYYDDLRKFLEGKKESLCEDCKSRYEKNPMRIIDCKEESCQKLLTGAPVMLDNLCGECRAHFEGVQKYLKRMDIEFKINPKIVRGLDYYTSTAFEFLTGDLGSQAAICAGGRYDGLAETLGGTPTPGIGFGLGIERLLLVLEAQKLLAERVKKTDIYIAPLCEEAKYTAMQAANHLRSKGYAVQTDMMGRSLKAQMKYADKINSQYVAMIGEDELMKDSALIRNMNSKEQFEVGLVQIDEIFSVNKGESI